MQNITFYILSCDRPNFLRSAIIDLLQYVDASLIKIMDNSSQPDEIYILQNEFPDIHFDIFGDRLNYISNFKRCIDDCITEYIVCLHDDDRLMNTFEAHFDNFSNSKCSFASGNGTLVDLETMKPAELLVNSKISTEINSVYQYARHKYRQGGGCIPFSPIIFRTKEIFRFTDQLIELGDRYEQSIDVILIALLLSKGSMFYSNIPIYYCGVHGGQDSMFMHSANENNVRSYLKYFMTTKQRIFFQSRLLAFDLREILHKIFKHG